MVEKARLLRDVFGHEDFREGQEALVDALLQGRDVLGIMPTGGGKSLCYQLPALLLPGVTLVISPLISLMKDQVSALKLNGVPAAFLNSSLTPGQQSLAIRRAAEGQYKIIYAAPERLDTPAFRRLCAQLPISLVAVDEAHCVSQWGQDFRPDYLRIADFINSLPQRPPVGAFTATATERVSQDIVRYLRLREPLRVTTGFDRPNLFFEVIPVKRKRDEVLLEALKRLPGQSGIVYCATRKNTDKVCECLRAHGYAAAAYHAGLSDEARQAAQLDFQYDRAQIIVATNAFGMGIDKSNVRFVIHYNMPKSIEAYYQEAGRAGRDGEDAVCLLLCSKSDITTARQLIYYNENPALSPEEAAQVRRAELDRLQAMIGYASADTCYRAKLLQYFGQPAPAACGGCSLCAPRRFPEAMLFAQDAALTRAERRALEAQNPVPGQQAAGSDPSPVQAALFEHLRQGRAAIAQRLGVPAYVVADDRCLKDMARKQPRTQEELLDVVGIGAHKAKQFGTEFLRLVSEGLSSIEGMAESDLADPAILDENAPDTSGKPAAAGQKWTETEHRQMLNMWQQDKSLDEIAQILGRTSGSIASRLKAAGVNPDLIILHSEATREEIHQARSSGATLSQLSESMRVPISVLLMTLYDMGLIQ